MQFDLRVLQQHAEQYRVPLKSGRGGAVMEWREHGLQAEPLLCGRCGAPDYRRHRGAAFGHLELSLVQPRACVASGTGRRQIHRQSVSAHGRNPAPLRRGQARTRPV